MEKISLIEQKSIMLEILGYIHQIAEKNDIKYSLWGGTMLGAVRHKGYIPWDDDIDIALPRKYYEKLIDILKSKEEYDLYEYSLKSNYFNGCAKLAHKNSVDKKKTYFGSPSSHGIFVDIVPIDGFPSNEKDIIAFKKKVNRMYLLVRFSNFPSYASSTELKKSLKMLFLFFPLYILTKIKGGKKKLAIELNEVSKSFPLEESAKCGHLLSRYRSNLGYPSSIWNNLSEYEFEGHYFKGITDSQTYLTLLYGKNYMEIPPKDKQETHTEHNFYRKDGETDEYSIDNGKWERSKNGAEYT